MPEKGMGAHFIKGQPMEHPGFFQKAGPFKLSEICDQIGIELPSSSDDLEITDVTSLADAAENQLCFLANRKLMKAFQSSKASVCLITKEFAPKAPDGMTLLVTDKPQEAFVKVLMMFYPESKWPQTSLSQGSLIDDSAVLEEGAIIEAGAIIGKEAHIGSGTRISAGAVIGYRCHIGRDCMIGPNVVINHSLIGNEVTIHACTAIGQDGFGYIMGPGGHKKVPQLGRVIIQDNVDIGANTAIDRGALGDTIIGEGTKIDNLVQIGHNVVIGCHAIIVALTGLSGSTKIGNFVAMGGQSGTTGHIEIGDGAQIAAAGKVHKSVPPNVRYGGTPAKPIKQFFKEIIALERLADNMGKNKQND